MQCKICGQGNPTGARFCANCGATLVAVVEPPSAVAVPGPLPAAPEVAVEYMGFWIRFGAAIIDFIAIAVISCILPFFAYWLYYWLFTGLKGQTPGKMVVGLKVINAQGDRPGLGCAALREVLGRVISIIVLCLGFLWIAFDNSKQGWHDKIAGTYVVRAEKAKTSG